MHYTLHLTNDCNMACTYCYVDRQNVQTMDIKTAQKVVDMAASSGSSSIGIIFFGGEPLLHKDLIEQVIEYSTVAASINRLQGESTGCLRCYALMKEFFFPLLIRSQPVFIKKEIPCLYRNIIMTCIH